MNLKDTILADMKTAMRDKDTVKLETVRLLRSAIQRKEVDDKIELDDQGVVAIVQKMVKQCTDAAEQFTRGERPDLAAKEQANIQYLSEYLPAQLGEEEVAAIIQSAIAETGATSMKDMGRVMGLVKNRLQGQADMGQVSARIKSLLG